MMVIIGGLIGSIFIVAQRFQMHTLHLKRVEEGLKSEIDTLASQQPYLNFQRDKALSTQESQKVASEYNLNQPGLGRAVVKRAETDSKAAEETEGVAIPSSSKVAKASGVAKVGGKQPALSKQPAKGMKNAKVVLAIKTAKPGGTGKPVQTGKPKKENKPANKQVSKSQPLRKVARH